LRTENWAAALNEMLRLRERAPSGWRYCDRAREGGGERKSAARKRKAQQETATLFRYDEWRQRKVRFSSAKVNPRFC
jgi:hypothetical protein